MTLEDKCVLILGGTSGIGLAVAEGAKAEGSDVIVVSSRQSRVDSALKLLGKRTEGFVADLSDERAIEALFTKVGPFDHLVYTAGDPVLQRPLGETSLEDAKKSFDVRFWGAVMAAKYGSRSIRPGGSIVFTSSTLPRRPVAGFAMGASLNGAMEGFAVSLAVELAPVRVNVVAPGIVRTPIWDRLPEAQREAYFASRAATLPVGRVGEAVDVAEAYLSFMRSRFTTGQILVVDGGRQLV
ncbi:SDR family oxidoreductase [Granulicella sp. S190]|uniref:SDR family oxidoreductase n=1 Tax=Granulicella sp. S190 TaxID=1747226 RepID=UPI00131E26ED|nr:SDR family oxidoreductase [Granulicella sp. S190]